MKRLDLNLGGYIDGTTYRIKPDLVKQDPADFVAQEDIIKMRTARVITRDEEGFAKVRDTAEEVPMGLCAFGFIDRLGTHEDYNVVAIGDGEGLPVATGAFQTTIPAQDIYFDGDLTAVKAGAKVYATVGKDGKMAFEGEDADVIGFVDIVGAEDITISVRM
jgi:hypothetical protein